MTVRSGNRFQLATITYFILGQLAFGLILGLINKPVGIVTSLLVSQLLFVALSVAVYVYLTKSNLIKDLFVRKMGLVDIIICVAIAWTIMPLLSTINILSQFFVENQIQDAMMEMLSLPLIITLILTGVFPAVFEELLTRSIILRHYQKQKVYVACLVSGIFFGFIHLNINQFLYAFIMGVVMCYVVMITGSIISSMVIHFTINATGTIMLYALNGVMKMFEENGVLMEELMSSAEPTTAQLLMSLFMIAGFALFMTPIAVILIRQLLIRHNKTFLGGLRLPTDRFMAMGTGSSDDSFQDEMNEAKEHNVTPILEEEEKIFTPALIITAMLFILFTIITEFALRSM